MIEIKECKFCNCDEFTYKEVDEIYNPETDEEEIINNVYICKKCNSYNFVTEEYIISQKIINKSIEPKTAELANYMNS